MYKILSIDGGGIKGIIPASFLANVEELTKNSVVDYFDLIVGTSTGGIIALGLGLGFSAREILSLYIDNGDKIFKKKSILESLFGMKGSIYSNKTLYNLLRNKFQGKRLGDSKSRLVIPAFDIVKNDICMFKTSHHERLVVDYKLPAEDVALSTAAAPYYFDPYEALDGRHFVDGGMFANNPILIGIIEGITLLEWPKNEIYVLSLGCSEETPEYGKLASNKSGIMHWKTGLIDLVFNSQSSYALSSAKLLLNDRNCQRIVRISPVLAKGTARLDDIKQSTKLVGLGKEEARQNIEKLKNIFFKDKVKAFIPYHKI